MLRKTKGPNYCKKKSVKFSAELLKGAEGTNGEGLGAVFTYGWDTG